MAVASGKPPHRQRKEQRKGVNILWIGFGKMGAPMACQVAAAGNQVSVFDAGEKQRSTAAANGLPVVDDVGAAAERADLIVTSLPDDAACREVLAVRDGVLSRCRRNACLIETSTISVGASREIAEVAEFYGAAYIRAPVSGTVWAAGAGSLTSFVSGPEGAFARMRETIGAYARNIVYVGSEDQARVMKLAVNLMVYTMMSSLSEAFSLCRKGGVDPKVAMEAISGSAIGSPHLRFKAESLLHENFTPTFTVRQSRKDLKLINEEARELGVAAFLGATVEQIMTATSEMGLDEEDYIACAKVYARMSGLP
jgi:3-hydroxyisobutyrate dehydrogenase-like beta-hydroxyacid dehydrogenase